jgi:hypothetical protein
MTLPSSNNPISLGQIQTEFGGSNPIALAGEYYRNGSYTTSNNTNVPTSGTISLSNFYGSRRAIYGCTDSSATNYNRNATDDDGTCSYPSSGGGGGDSCTEKEITTEYGVGFEGYLIYGNPPTTPITQSPNENFITGTNSTYLAKDKDANGNIVYIITKGGVETTYGEIGKYIVDYYTTKLGRYPDGETFGASASWFWEFLNISGYKSFADLGNAINTAFYGTGGESERRVKAGGLVGNYNNCGLLKK